MALHLSSDNAPATSTAKAYYNEIDPFAAQWLRNLIANGQIAPGDVDERSIVDVRPADLAGYTQCHFFAGIGVWSAALRAANWPDTRRIWTASCPCQPFSAAGKGGGFDDERHLWPALQWLIQQCRPDTVFGEQVASKDGLGWLDLVSTDLEAMGYACGAVPSPAAGIGAPHIRQRLYWVADATNQRHEWSGGTRGWRTGPADDGEIGFVAQPDSGQLAGQPVIRGTFRDGQDAGRSEGGCEPKSYCEVSPLANDNRSGQRRESVVRLQRPHVHDIERCCEHGLALGDANDSRLAVGQVAPVVSGTLRHQGPTIGTTSTLHGRTFWSDSDWIWCRDGKYRPVEPRSFPLAHGLARGMGTLGTELRGLAEVAGLDGKSLARAKKHRVGSLKGYGNAIVRQHAQAFIEAYLSVARSSHTPANDNTNRKESHDAAA